MRVVRSSLPGVSLAVLLLVGCRTPTSHAPAAREPAASAPSPPAPATRMATFTLHGYLLAGAEYWPYTGTAEIEYPAAVLWGFYPAKGELAPGEDAPNVDSARPEAIACAETAFAALQQFLATDPPKLRRIVEVGEAQGFVPRFYLWTNDYGRAATPYPPGVREARLWYWKRKQPAPPKPPGYWKWESSLTQAGVCQIPQPAQIDAYLSETLRGLEAR